MKLKYNRKFFMFIVIIAAILLFNMVATIRCWPVYAESSDTYSDEQNNTQASARGLVSLSISIDCGDYKVWTTAKNNLTILPSTVIVIVELYSSYEYVESYEDMTLTAYNTIDDLNIGKIITAEASTNNETMYWLGRMRYKIDSGNWQSKCTSVCKISGTGEFLGYI